MLTHCDSGNLQVICLRIVFRLLIVLFSSHIGNWTVRLYLFHAINIRNPYALITVPLPGSGSVGSASFGPPGFGPCSISQRRREIIVRGHLFLSSSKILTPHPPLRPASVYRTPRLCWGEDTLARRRGGWGVNILEGERDTGLPSYSK